MSKFNNFERIVIYQPRSAWVCDLGSGHALSPRYSPSEDYFATAAGTRKPVARSRPLVIPVFDEDKIRYLRTMHKEGCEIRALLIGKGANLVWDLDSEFNMVEFGAGPREVSGVNIIMDTDLFAGSIYQGADLLSGIPWECETGTDDGTGTFYFPGPSGWQGNKYVVSTGDAVDEDGLFSGSGAPQLTMYLPLEGATFQLEGAWIGTMITRDWTGATLTSTSKLTNGATPSGTIDDGTWTVEFNVTTANSRPEMYITAAGALASNRPGECIDCSDLDAVAAAAPGWSS